MHVNTDKGSQLSLLPRRKAPLMNLAGILCTFWIGCLPIAGFAIGITPCFYLDPNIGGLTPGTCARLSGGPPSDNPNDAPLTVYRCISNSNPVNYTCFGGNDRTVVGYYITNPGNTIIGNQQTQAQYICNGQQVNGVTISNGAVYYSGSVIGWIVTLTPSCWFATGSPPNCQGGNCTTSYNNSDYNNKGYSFMASSSSTTTPFWYQQPPSQEYQALLGLWWGGTMPGMGGQPSGQTLLQTQMTASFKNSYYGPTQSATCWSRGQ